MNSEDYHNYVFRDGKLVGKFDVMYKNFNGRPLVHFRGIIEKGEKHNEKKEEYYKD